MLAQQSGHPDVRGAAHPARSAHGKQRICAEETTETGSGSLSRDTLFAPLLFLDVLRASSVCTPNTSLSAAASTSAHSTR